MKRSIVRDDVATEVDLFKVLRARPLVITKGSALEIPQNTMMYGTGWLGLSRAELRGGRVEGRRGGVQEGPSVAVPFG